MPKNDLNNFRCFGSIHAETIIPKATSNQKSTIDRCHKAIGTDFQFLTKIIAQMATYSWITIAVGLNCEKSENKLFHRPFGGEKLKRKRKSSTHATLDP